MGRRKQKRLKTGDKPDEEVVVLKVRVKVESDNNKEEESSDEMTPMKTKKRKNNQRNQ
jgi:hypothetical protein